MFLSSKLVGIITTIVVSGSASSLLIPYFQNASWTDWLYKQDDSKDKFNFDQLDKDAEAKLKILKELFKKFVLAESAAKSLKSFEWKKIEWLFDSIKKLEEQLKNLFTKITDAIAQLLEKNKQRSEASEKKLIEDKQEQLQKSLQTSYAEVTGAFSKWEDSLWTISCAISKETNCEQNNERHKQISRLLHSFLSLASLLTSSKKKQADAPPLR